jgi:hypothetical protein
MKRISLWAKRHKWSARLLVIIINILLIALAVNVGDLLQQLGIVFPALSITLCSIVCAILFVLYPVGERVSYHRRKIFDILVGGSSFILVLCISNSSTVITPNVTAHAAVYVRPVVSPSAHPVLEFIKIIQSTDVAKLSNRQKLKLLKEQFKRIKKDKSVSDGDKGPLVALSILVALALLYGLAALSCSIACSGSGALAWLVFLGGTTLIVLLLVRTIKRINSGKKRVPRSKRQVDTDAPSK